jgi:hypothetical protein
MILQATYHMRSEMRSIFATASQRWVEIASVSCTNEFSIHAQVMRRIADGYPLPEQPAFWLAHV